MGLPIQPELDIYEAHCGLCPIPRTVERLRLPSPDIVKLAGNAMHQVTIGVALALILSELHCIQGS